MASYIGYDYRAGQAINVGDLVISQDEWGYWRADPERATGRIESHHGWLTTLVRADGTRMLSDGHTCTMHLVAD